MWMLRGRVRLDGRLETVWKEKQSEMGSGGNLEAWTRPSVD